MKNIITNCNLFENVDLAMISNTILKTYKKNSIVVQEGDICDFIAYIYKGEISIDKHLLNGNILTINKLSKNMIFGAALLFSENNKFSYQATATMNTSISFINKDEINKLVNSNTIFCKNYIWFLSNKVNYFTDKLNLLNYKDVRSRLLIYLYNEIQKQQTTSLNITHTREQIGNIISITRPSVSRELQNMVKDNILEISKNKIKIIDMTIFNAIKLHY